MKQKKSYERGSVLVLSLICVLILSFLVEGILDVSQTEMYTTQNYQLGRMAFYKALEGVEDVREHIASVIDPNLILTDVYRTVSDTVQEEGGLTYSYITGDLVDFENDDYSKIRQFTGFNAPSAVGVSSNVPALPMIWEVAICSRIESGSKRIYSQVRAGVYQLVPTTSGE